MKFNYQAIIDMFKSIMDWFVDKDPKAKLTIVIAAILGFLIFKYIQNEKQRHVETQNKIEQFEQKLIACNDVLEQNSSLKEELTQLKVNNIMLKATSDYLPFPFWIKDRSGTMIYLNNAYEKKYLAPRNLTSLDYIGKKDNAIWGDEIAEQFKKHDSIVLAKNKPVTFTELGNNKVTKFTVELGDYIIGVAGAEYTEYYY